MLTQRLCGRIRLWQKGSPITFKYRITGDAIKNSGAKFQSFLLDYTVNILFFSQAETQIKFCEPKCERFRTYDSRR